MIKKSNIFEVFERQDKRRRTLYTKNLVVDSSVYGETIIQQKEDQFREWDVGKSKLGSCIIKGCTNVGIRNKSSVLYLGCATGTTVSHVSDMVGKEGVVFAVDLSPTVMREMVLLSEVRENIIPIMESANHVENLAARILPVDVIFQDIAQIDQVPIFLKNVASFLKPKGYALLAVKSRSIDVTKKPRQVYKQVRADLEKHLKIIDYRELDPFQKDHCMFVCKK